MSTFKVSLLQGGQGGQTGSGYAVDPAIDGDITVQRTMDCTGPNLTRRTLIDGAEFEDCNYWKRFTASVIGKNAAFIEVVSDDGSVYTDGGSSVFPKVADLTVLAASSYDDSGNSIDIVAAYGGPAVSTQITTDEDIKVRLNGDSGAVIDVAAGTVTFDIGDFILSEIAFDNSVSGASDATVQVLFGIESVCNS